MWMAEAEEVEDIMTGVAGMAGIEVMTGINGTDNDVRK
jgi:hypothetical protein